MCAAPAPASAMEMGRELLQRAGVEATFVAVDPPHRSWLALWHPHVPLVEADDVVELVLPAGRQVRRRQVPVRRLELIDGLPLLLDLPAGSPAADSVRSWAVAARLAVELVARGRLQPRSSPTGTDRWRLGPLERDDVQRRTQLADALPPAAHATPIAGRPPLRISSPLSAVTAFGDAIADLLPRTAAAPTHAGHPAFAARTDAAAELQPDEVDWLEGQHAADDAPAAPSGSSSTPRTRAPTVTRPPATTGPSTPCGPCWPSRVAATPASPSTPPRSGPPPRS